MRLCFLFFCFFVAATRLFAQGDLTRDRAFFEEQAQVYQDWLERQGIGQHLFYKDMYIDPDTLLVYLEFAYEDRDSIISIWDQLKTSYEQNSALTLEQRMFYQLAMLMQVEQEQLELMFAETYLPWKDRNFDRAISFNPATGKVEVSENNPRSHKRTISFPASQLPKAPRNAVLPLEGDSWEDRDRTHLFNIILHFADSLLSPQTCAERDPEFKMVEDEEVLRFRALNLCQVVLTDANKSFWGSLFGYNDIPRELLEFIIAYEPTYQGVKLEIEVIGKYGAGYYKEVDRGAYHDMTTNPRFEEIYLKEYADDFARELKAYLRRR